MISIVFYRRPDGVVDEDENETWPDFASDPVEVHHENGGSHWSVLVTDEQFAKRKNDGLTCRLWVDASDDCKQDTEDGGKAPLNTWSGAAPIEIIYPDEPVLKPETNELKAVEITKSDKSRAWKRIVSARQLGAMVVKKQIEIEDPIVIKNEPAKVEAVKAVEK